MAKLEVVARQAPKADALTQNIRKVGVIGAGQMGNGIAHVSALAGSDNLMVASSNVSGGCGKAAEAVRASRIRLRTILLLSISLPCLERTRCRMQSLHH